MKMWIDPASNNSLFINGRAPLNRYLTSVNLS